MSKLKLDYNRFKKQIIKYILKKEKVSIQRYLGGLTANVEKSHPMRTISSVGL